MKYKSCLLQVLPKTKTKQNFRTICNIVRHESMTLCAYFSVPTQLHFNKTSDLRCLTTFNIPPSKSEFFHHQQSFPQLLTGFDALSLNFPMYSQVILNFLTKNISAVSFTFKLNCRGKVFTWILRFYAKLKIRRCQVLHMKSGDW